MDIANEIASVLSTAQQKAERNAPGDYQENGLWYCGKCKTAKQTRVNFGAGPVVVWCSCHCAAKARQQEAAAREAAENIRRLKNTAFAFRDLSNRTFQTSEKCKTLDIAWNYVQNWGRFSAAGKGLLFYGEASRGKTHAAACIINELLSRGVPCLMTNFERLINELDAGWNRRQEIIDGLNNYKMLAIDDLGAERTDDRKRGYIYSIIDNRALAKLPLIITTNLTREQLGNPGNIDNARIYERIFEICHPVKVEGPNRRRVNLQNDFNEINSILGV